MKDSVWLAKAAAIDKVELSNAEWIDAVMGKVQDFLKRLSGQDFIASDLWWYLFSEDVPRPAEPRAMGALLRRLCREKRIRPRSVWWIGTRVKSHGRPERVWSVTRE